MASHSSRAQPNQAAPVFDGRELRLCLGQYATGVTVITAQGERTRAGVTANSFASLSLDPPLISWAISRRSRSFETFRAASHFAVNILASDQIHVAQSFAGSSADKFAGIAWSRGRAGTPVLEGVSAVLECRTVSTVEGGDHLLLVGHVESFTNFDRVGLLFVQGRYAIAEDHPSLKPTDSGSADQLPDRTEPLLVLLARAHHSVVARFEEHRRAEGVTLTENKVMAGLYDNAGITLEELTRRMYLGSREAEDAISELMDSGDLARDTAGRLSLTLKGRARRAGIVKRVAEFEAEQLRGIPDSELSCAGRFFTRLLNK